MDNSNFVKVTMDTADTVIFRAISEIDEARIKNFVKDFLGGVSNGSFWKTMKSLEDQGAIINRPTKRGSSFFLSKSMHEPTDNNSNTINTGWYSFSFNETTVSFPSNTPVCPNYDTDQ